MAADEQNTQANSLPSSSDSRQSGSTTSWFPYTILQAQELSRRFAESTDTVIRSTSSGLAEIGSSASPYSVQGMFKTFKTAYGHYEDIFFGNLKDGLKIANEHSGITCVMVGLGVLFMRRPRRLLFRYTIGRFQSEESRFTNNEKRVKELRQYIELLKNESKKLEERTKLAEDELIRGRTKLEKVGTQVRSLVSSIRRTEKHAKGLMENLRDLPGRDALLFRAQVASLAAEAKQRRDSLSKEVSRIASHGINV